MTTRATFSGFDTALSALQANQKRLDITGQNLANMNTVGYTRQQLDTVSIAAPTPGFYSTSPALGVGTGVRMTGVSQLHDPFLDNQYRLQMRKASSSDAFQTTLDSLSSILDETDIDGISKAFDDIQSTLTSMSDPSNVSTSLFENELRSRMDKLAKLLNSTAADIENAKKTEYGRLNGSSSGNTGSIDQVNEMLTQIGELNRQIKRQELFGQNPLELKDERNRLLDELSGYIPIEVTYTNDKKYDSVDELRVDLVYKNNQGQTQKLTLIDGTSGRDSENRGQLAISGGPDAPKITVTTAASTATGTTTDDSKEFGKNTDNTLEGGSIAAGLEALISDGKNGGFRGYDYYMNQLDTLAQEFAKAINDCNNGNYGNNGSVTPNKGKELLDDGKGNPDPKKITAANISVSEGWVNGTVHITMDDTTINQTVLDMLAAMKTPQTALDNNTFTDFMNHVSTTLANDSYNNSTTLKTNVTVLNGVQNSRDSISGVSLDEEAANMMAYISAYNAASRLMTTLDEALDKLINGTGRVGL